MKIAIFTDTYEPQINGVVTSTLSFQKQLEKMGHTVYVMCPKVEGAMESTEKIWRFRSVAYPFQKEYRVVVPYSRQLKRFKSIEFDVVHIQTPFSMGYLGQYIANKYKLPIVHTYHTYFMEYLHYVPILPLSLMQQFANRESRRFCNKCDAIVVPSHSIKQALIDYKVRVPIHVIPTGIEPLNVSQSEIDLIQNQIGISKEDIILLFVGRVAKEKNISFLIDSFDYILKKEPKAKLVIVGDGPERESIEKKIDEKMLSKQVIITGYLNKTEVYSMYASAKCLVFPSKTETQGLTVVEALSMGIPAVCINEMGVADILEGNVGGFLTEDSIESYTEKVLALIQDNMLYDRKRKEALDRAKRYSVSELSNQLIQVYERVISR